MFVQLNFLKGSEPHSSFEPLHLPCEAEVVQNSLVGIVVISSVFPSLTYQILMY